MGLTLRFYIGDSKRIEKAIRESEIDLLYDPEVVHKCADLSLHIVPRDLDLLSRQFGKHSRRKPLDLRPHLGMIIDENDRGLLSVDKAWVKYIAKARVDAADRIVGDWFEAMRQEYPEEEIKVTQAARSAVRDLVELCKEATRKRAKVLHVWFA